MSSTQRPDTLVRDPNTPASPILSCNAPPVHTLGSRAVLLTVLLPPQIRVRSTPDSRHDSDGPEHLRLVPTADTAADGDPCLRGRGRPLPDGTGERCLSEASIRLKQILLS